MCAHVTLGTHSNAKKAETASQAQGQHLIISHLFYIHIFKQ